MQPKKAWEPIDLSDCGMVTEVSEVHLKKARCARNSAGQPAGFPLRVGGGQEERTGPMFVTEWGMVSEASAVSRKALKPMFMTESGMVTEVSTAQPSKA
mgnify:CR=1 FL=1